MAREIECAGCDNPYCKLNVMRSVVMPSGEHRLLCKACRFRLELSAQYDDSAWIAAVEAKRYFNPKELTIGQGHWRRKHVKD